MCRTGGRKTGRNARINLLRNRSSSSWPPLQQAVQFLLTHTCNYVFHSWRKSLTSPHAHGAYKVTAFSHSLVARARQGVIKTDSSTIGFRLTCGTKRRGPAHLFMILDVPQYQKQPIMNPDFLKVASLFLTFLGDVLLFKGGGDNNKVCNHAP